MGERKWRPEVVTEHGWLLGVVGDEVDGEQELWFFDPALVRVADGVVTGVGRVVIPPHEDVGPLPDKFQRRIDGDCCGFVTAHGVRCSLPPDRCPYEWHRADVIEAQRREAHEAGLCGAPTRQRGRPCRNPAAHCRIHSQDDVSGLPADAPSPPRGADR